MIDQVLLLRSLAAIVGLVLMAMASGAPRLVKPRTAGVFLFLLLIAYSAFMFWGMARRAADHDRSTRVLSADH